MGEGEAASHTRAPSLLPFPSLWWHPPPCSRVMQWHTGRYLQECEWAAEERSTASSSSNGGSARPIVLSGLIMT